MHLPWADAADVGEIKVRDYLLNPAHPQNGGKSRFFQAFGFALARWDVLRDALSRHPAINPVAVTSQSAHGAKFVVRCSLRTPDGRDPCITTVWIIEGNGPPRLVTAYP